jgi:hypothetical protein
MRLVAYVFLSLLIGVGLFLAFGAGVALTEGEACTFNHDCSWVGDFNHTADGWPAFGLCLALSSVLVWVTGRVLRRR